jgi:anaerobic selenocysteine-containing dehydrogenase
MSTTPTRISERRAEGSAPSTSPWLPTACILCSENCGLEVRVEGGRLVDIRGDERSPDSRGYLCQKAARLDYYQNGADRLDAPLKRRPDGTFERVSWEQALREVGERLRALRERHGGRSVAYVGGGGQGNHLGGVYGSALRAALGTPWVYSALAQEKTGDFWVNGRLFGRQTVHVTQGVEDADFVLFLGTNPWQSHGFPRARKVLKELQRDPSRTLVVIDPRRTETARMADVHLQVRPGRDAFLLAALLGVIAQEGLEDAAFLAQRTRGWEEVRRRLLGVPVEAFAAHAGVDVEQTRRVARGLAAARAATVRADLGLQQSFHSTLNSYLEKLLFLVTGNLGKRGTNNFHTVFVPLLGHSPEPDDAGELKTAVTGMHPIGKLYPPNVLPLEIDTDHPGRVRGVVVDSANPLVSGADTQAYRAAFAKLELLVVIDVAMTETAALAHYVLPAPSQLEKSEATFFNLGFPENVFHLRRPVLPPREGTLPEPEIYRRLCVALGALPERTPVLEALARLDRRAPRWRLFPVALKAALALRPRLRAVAPLLLYQTLGRALPDGLAAAAALWPAALFYASRHARALERAGVRDGGAGLGEALFERLLDSPHGLVLSRHTYDDTWAFLRTPDRRVHLAIPALLEQLEALAGELAGAADEAHADYPFLLMAGERRSYNANTIYRNPAWRKKDAAGALRLHPDDAARLGLEKGGRLRVESARGAVEVVAEPTPEMLPGVVSLPHGYGMTYPAAGAEPVAHGPLINLLTDSRHCDPLTMTPYHKTVPVRLVALDR